MRKKTGEQIEAIRGVQRATEAAMSAVTAYLRTALDPTAEKAHAIIDATLARHDCESPEGHIVAAGEQSVEPHETGKGRLEKGVSIVIDIYPRSQITGYFADMSRTVCIGPASAALQNMYGVVRDAQMLAISMVKPGVRCLNIQSAVEDMFTNAGYTTSGKGTEFLFAEGFVHGVGHGVGLEVHEAPRIGRGSQDVLEEGDVITIEPGLYYKGIGGVRLEDIVVVTPDGAKNITNFPKTLTL